jgi:hypothetical protein
MIRVAKPLIVLLALVLLASCAPAPAPPPVPTITAPANFPAEVYETATGGSVFAIDPAQSIIEMRVYRDGPLARFGHNHVITGAIEGRIFLADEFPQSRADVYVSVLDLIVDDTAARAAAGADFAADVDPDSVQATRGNLLGPDVLHGAQYPHLQAQIRPITASERAMATLHIKDHVAPTPVAIDWRVEGNRLTAEAAFSIRQSELGITPFSVMGGGLRVRDAIEVQVEVNAAIVD